MQRYGVAREIAREAVTSQVRDDVAVLACASSFVQVEEDNTPAQALYARYGFTGHHGYHYRTAPGAG
jgi:ribosomal protein S18 acetylase RimI-like enzyme